MARVHIKSDVKNQHSNYWHLTIPDTNKSDLTAQLKADGISHTKTSSKRHLRDLHIRHQRGFLSYAKCDVEELQRFCSDRRLNPPPEAASRSKSRFKQLLVNHLEAADDDFTFDKFLDIPEELRLEIYEHYFWDLEAGLEKIQSPIWYRDNSVRAQPPITRTSRAIRREALPLFYQNCPFRFGICSGDSGRSFWDSNASHFLQAAPKDVLDRVKNFIIAGDVNGLRGYNWVIRVSHQGIKSESRPEAPEHIQAVMRQRMIAFPGSPGSKPRDSGLRGDDRAAMLALFNDIEE